MNGTQEAHSPNGEMRGRTSAFLISGRTRREIAAAIVEYRTFARLHPEAELAPELSDIAGEMHDALHWRRHVNRAIGANLRSV